MNHCLLAIQDIVICIGSNLILQYRNRNYAMEINYDQAELAETLETDVLRLLAEYWIMYVGV